MSALEMGGVFGAQVKSEIASFTDAIAADTQRSDVKLSDETTLKEVIKKLTLEI